MSGTDGRAAAAPRRMIVRAIGWYRSRPPRERAAGLAAVALLVAAGAVAVTVPRLGVDSNPDPGAAVTPTSADPAAEVDALPRSAPVRLVIPALGLDAPVSALDLVEGELAALPDRDSVGWYGRAASPGEPGSAVLVGYANGDGPSVDGDGPDGAASDGTDAADEGEGAFAGLRRLAPGDLIEVAREDGTTARFEVEEVRPYEAGTPDDPTGPPRLRLVGSRHGAGSEVDETSDVVVFAVLVSDG